MFSRIDEWTEGLGKWDSLFRENYDKHIKAEVKEPGLGEAQIMVP